MGNRVDIEKVAKMLEEAAEREELHLQKIASLETQLEEKENMFAVEVSKNEEMQEEEMEKTADTYGHFDLGGAVESTQTQVGNSASDRLMGFFSDN